MSRLTGRGGSRSSRSAGRDAVDAGDAASRGARGRSDVRSGHRQRARTPLARRHRPLARKTDPARPRRTNACSRTAQVAMAPILVLDHGWCAKAGRAPGGVAEQVVNPPRAERRLIRFSESPGALLLPNTARVQAQGCIGHPAFRTLSRRRGRANGASPGRIALRERRRTLAGRRGPCYKRLRSQRS